MTRRELMALPLAALAVPAAPIARMPGAPIGPWLTGADVQRSLDRAYESWAPVLGPGVIDLGRTKVYCAETIVIRGDVTIHGGVFVFPDFPGPYFRCEHGHHAPGFRDVEIRSGPMVWKGSHCVRRSGAPAPWPDAV